MDRPTTWQSPPPRQNNGKPRRVFRVEVPLPDIDIVDAVLHVSSQEIQE
jgi:hypothetical protein